VPGTITNTSGTAALANVPTIPGSYTIQNVTANTFDIAFASTLGTLANTSGTAADTTLTPVQLSTTVQDYAAIPGGYWVLPNNQLIANEAAQVRANAFPITYKLLLTQTGLLSFQYSYNGGVFQPVLTNQSISAANGPMPSSFRFGFTAATGGSNNVHEISCFLAQPTQSASSAGANTIQSGQVRTGTQIYLATYDPNNWFGSIVSDPLVVSNGVPSVSSNATWDANCNLTGGGCASMGTDVNGNPLNTVSVQSPSSRQLLTWNGTSGIALQWGSLAGAQQTVLNASDSLGQNRLDWLRGGRGNEQSAGGALRQRTGVLGDVINSSPTWVGNPSMGYPTVFTDRLYGASGAPENAGGAQSYNTYATNNVSRTNVVYSGSNDGLVHGFRTGSNNADGSYNSTNNDGVEVLGFMPSSVLANANVVSLTSPLYAHQYFVDATPGTGDLFYNNSWHTWLVGGLGTGGAEIYALDITDPSQFSESNAASLVKGDWTATTLTNLGNTVGTPIIRRLHNGQWAIIFGNGFGSSTGHAGVYVGLVNASTGAVTYSWLDTGAGSSSNPDGIGYVTSADVDSDNVTDYLYAGDLLGNVWRFDLTSSNTADWAVSKFGNATPTPLFVAQDSGGNPQPITTEVAIGTSNTGGAKRVIAMFGTGQKNPLTASSAETYASGTQTVYGIWDWDMSAWNNGTTTVNGVTIPASAATYAALTAPQTVTRSDLLAQTLSSQVAAASGNQVLGYRAISSTNNVCWTGSAASCAQYGWLFDLPDTNEQVVYGPIIESGSLIVNTTIPPSSSVNQCNPTLPSGWTMAFNIASGGGQSQNFFPDSSGSLTPSSAGFSLNGIRLDGTGSSRVVTVGSTPYIVTQTVTGQPSVSRINPTGLSAPTVTRMTWEEIL
jgi:type IV pilus assembly protein PilY1